MYRGRAASIPIKPDSSGDNLNSINPAEDNIRKISGAHAGFDMDRAVAKKVPYGFYGLIIVALIFAIFLGLWIVDIINGGRSLAVNSERINISPVTQGVYEDFIPLRGRLVPRNTVYLDAVEGGRVEQVLVEDGIQLTAGEPIVLLSNTSLQLDVLSREAAVAEQLNNMRTIELQLEQNRLSHRRNLADMDYRVLSLSRQLERQSTLLDRNLISKSETEDLQDELAYYENRRDITLESQATDALMQEQQLTQLRETGNRLQTNLSIARQTLDDLSVRAPVEGELSGFDIQVGQSIGRGQRLGQIDDPEGYKLNVQIDEYYLGRVDLGQPALADYNNKEYDLRTSKIYPQVSNGLFNVDMLFENEPQGLRRGQTLQLRLVLGDNSDAILIPNGTFYQETGGSWIFVLSADGTEAVRRTVKMGRRNTEFIEVLDGLEPGERVITSPYTSYLDMDRLALN